MQAAIDTVAVERPSALTDGTLAITHCVSAYPKPREEANVANVRWLRDTFGLPIGYSDHTLGLKACELAVAAGAVFVEKHLTYRPRGADVTTMPFPHYPRRWPRS